MSDRGMRSTQLALDGPRLERRGGIGPVQPIWEDVRTYSPEWYRRFRDWHLATYPDSDHVTHGNLLMLIACADDSARNAPLVEARKTDSDE